MDSNTTAASVDGSVSISNEASLRSITMIAYILYGLGIFTGFTPIAGLVVAYVKRPDVAGTIYQSHLTWLIRTFWLGAIPIAVGAVTMMIGIGFLIFLAWGIWFIYRIVFGYIKFNDRKPIDNPNRFF